MFKENLASWKMEMICEYKDKKYVENIQIKNELKI